MAMPQAKSNWILLTFSRGRAWIISIQAHEGATRPFSKSSYKTKQIKPVTNIHGSWHGC